MKGTNIVTVCSAHIIRTVDRQEQTEFTLINEWLEIGKEGDRVYGHIGGSGGDKERDWSRESIIKGGLGVEKIERPVVGRVWCVGRGEDSSHFGR
jgi:hypothetical protein